MQTLCISMISIAFKMLLHMHSHAFSVFLLCCGTAGKNLQVAGHHKHELIDLVTLAEQLNLAAAVAAVAATAVRARREPPAALHILQAL